MATVPVALVDELSEEWVDDSGDILVYEQYLSSQTVLQFPSGLLPSYGTAEEVEIAVDEAQFGEGYTLRASPGINHTRSMWSVVWENIPEIDKKVLTSFFRMARGVLPFAWTAPGEDQPKLFTCKKFSSTPVGYQAFTVRATFREEFDL